MFLPDYVLTLILDPLSMHEGLFACSPELQDVPI